MNTTRGVQKPLSAECEDKLHSDIILLDCTLRDGGYYNAWDFSPQLIDEYLVAMKAAQVDVVELGFRFLLNKGFKGPCAFTTDEFLDSLSIPSGLTVAVMMNGADLCTEIGCIGALQRLFPRPASETKVELVRFACHFRELPQALPAAGWLTERGYRVGFNVMQIADRSREEVFELTRMACDWPVEVLYFADSMGSMRLQDVESMVGWLQEGWKGALGIHTHDNMGLALSNSLCAAALGVSWLDSTVTGMGRGPGNARTEELMIEAEALRGRNANMIPLMSMIRRHFVPMKAQYGWGTNPYYYLSGRHGIHPSYIQEVLGDVRYDDDDIIAVINFLRDEGGKSFSSSALDGARRFYSEPPRGTWKPANTMGGREVLILGAGQGVSVHRQALEAYIRRAQPVVIALNTQSSIDSSLISLRIACHPVRLLADAETHTKLPQPLITPASMLPRGVRAGLGQKELLDFGLAIEPGRFEFHDTYGIAPTSIVLAYALTVVKSGQASQILMAGFDGYPPGDPRNDEVEDMLEAFMAISTDVKLISITPTSYSGLPACSLYGL